MSEVDSDIVPIIWRPSGVVDSKSRFATTIISAYLRKKPQFAL